MNDYPFNRIVLDIVELLQDLRVQGMACIFNLETTGGISIYLFTDRGHVARWTENQDKELLRRSFSDGDCNAAHMAWNDLHDFKDLAEHHAAVEKMLCDREYIIENLMERVA
jgi:hypothetical protein